MPIPGGVLALQQSLSFYPAVQRQSRRTCSPFVSDCSSGTNSPDPQQQTFLETSRHFKENLRCNMMFFNNDNNTEVPPSQSSDKVHGVLVVETKNEVVHSGMFILMKGLTLPPKKRHVSRLEENNNERRRSVVNSLKFKVVGGSGHHCLVIEEGSRKSYPLELELPKRMEELPPPIITGEGKLIYKLQLFMTTTEGRHVQVGESKLRLQGMYSEDNVEDKPVNMQVHVQSKRSILALGRKKTVNLEVEVPRSTWFPQEDMKITVKASTQDKNVTVDLKLELIQKVWYQAPVSGGRSNRMSVKLKINVVAATPTIKLPVEQGTNDVIWEDVLGIPEGLTPTYKYDFLNSVNYMLRLTAGFSGEKKDAVLREEVPVYIRTSYSDCGHDDDNRSSGATWSYDDVSPCRSGSETPQRMRTSRSLTFIPFNESRSGSLSPAGRSAIRRSRAESVIRLPPSYSQLSSRRPTLETLPPDYCELELQEKSLLQNAGDHDLEDNA